MCSVINSVIVKSSKLTRATKVYRGIAGGVLPDSFWEANARECSGPQTQPESSPRLPARAERIRPCCAEGVRGGIESAFMSTTFERDVAMQYACVPGKPALVFEIQMGMIDRGAELGWSERHWT